METPSSRRYEQLVGSSDKAAAVKKIVGTRGAKGMVDVLDVIYERFGKIKDVDGQKIVESLIESIEAQNYFKGTHDMAIQPKNGCSEQHWASNAIPRKQAQNEACVPSGEKKKFRDLRNEQKQPLDYSSKEEPVSADQKAGKSKKPKKSKKKCQKLEDVSEKSGIIADQDQTFSSEEKKKEPKEKKEKTSKNNGWGDEEDGFGDFDIQVVRSEDLQLMEMPKGCTKYLNLKDLSPEYRYVYLNKYDDDLIKEIYKEFQDAEMVGVDSEFHLKNAKCSYIQISTPTFGAIFNIRNVEFRNHPVFKDYLRKLLESTKVVKVGHSLLQDLKVIRRAFFGELDFKTFLSLEECLFTCRTNVLSLSGICKRLFSLPLNKDFQAWIGEQDEMDTHEEREYAIMDALAPLVAYQRLKPFCEAKVQKGTFMVNCAQRDQIDRSEFLLDHHMELIRVFLERSGLKFSVLKEKTYEGKLKLTRTRRDNKVWQQVLNHQRQVCHPKWKVQEHFGIQQQDRFRARF